jgi:hypothetical protein
MANNEKPNSWGQVLLIPVVVGILVAVVTFFLPKFFEKGKRLSYETVGPIQYVNSAGLAGLTITFNGDPVDSAYGYRVRVWNSGDVPLANLPIQFYFSTDSPGFKILSVRHDTIPQQEFGKVDEQGGDKLSKRFVYELLNPKDEDTVTLVTNQQVPPTVYAKASGLRLDHTVAVEAKGYWEYATFSLALLSVVSSFLTILLKPAFRKLSEVFETIFVKRD